jgi:phosphatidylserine/phosphatidylglycerophosphate/cardiolipin synthase-like enzyme
MTQQKAITTPIALDCTNSATLTLPWFVQRTEYNPAQATFKPLVNGEEAFGAVYEAIMNARRSVDIICWGFQPSMYFKRGNTDTVPIGQLLAQKGADGVRVRLLCWMDDLHVAEWSENNMPGNNVATMLKPHLKDWMLSMPGMSMVSRDYQRKFELEFDLEWYRRANLNNVTKGRPMRQPFAVAQDAFKGVEFATRDFSLSNRAEIAYRTALLSKDSQRSARIKTQNSLSMGTAEPTHHQKMVLVDYELPDQAIGFVMGHNMLDTYWDRDDHSYVRMHPRMGRNGEHPRQDMSSRVSGPVLEYLNRNFCQAWDHATGQSLAAARKGIASQLKLRRDFDTPVMAQILRTQSQHDKRDIETMYLQAVNNTTKFIYIENQYFRYVPLAEKIKDAVAAQIKGGRDPGRHGSIYLFVVTNSNDEGIGAGTVNTYRMLNALGSANAIPGVAREERADALKSELADARKQVTAANTQMRNASGAQEQATAQQAQTAAQAREAALQQRIRENGDDSRPILPAEIQGLKIHVCTLVAPDSPPGKWDYVYIHAKLMVVDDVFMTLGSANINIRSMEADSELNICHERMDVTQPLRRRLWDIHTGGKGVQDDPAEAFVSWGDIINQNADNQKKQSAPYASLVGFMRTSKDRSYSD